MLKKFLFVVFLSITIAACQKANDVVIDDSPLINAQLAYFDKDSIDIAAYTGTKNLPTISDSFQVNVSSTEHFSHLSVVVQNDSGNTLTQVSFLQLSGNLISGKFSFSPTSVYVGNLTYTFTAYNSAGSLGDYAIKVVRLFNSASNPPVVDSVSVPDSVQIAATDTIAFSLYAYVHDPNGLSDISDVYFNSTLPNGTSGGQFQLSPQSPIGNEGIYMLTIGLPPLSANNPPPLGTYKFTFYAVNRSGVTSAPVSHNIKVYQ
jgi:hypothetical protein